jgi:hypothetical protein
MPRSVSSVGRTRTWCSFGCLEYVSGIAPSRVKLTDEKRVWPATRPHTVFVGRDAPRSARVFLLGWTSQHSSIAFDYELEQPWCRERDHRGRATERAADRIRTNNRTGADGMPNSRCGAANNTRDAGRLWKPATSTAPTTWEIRVEPSAEREDG